jgi:hypothetical protein
VGRPLWREDGSVFVYVSGLCQRSLCVRQWSVKCSHESWVYKWSINPKPCQQSLMHVIILSRVGWVTWLITRRMLAFNPLFIWPFLGRATIIHFTALQHINQRLYLLNSVFCTVLPGRRIFTSVSWTLDSLSWADVNWTWTVCSFPFIPSRANE